MLRMAVMLPVRPLAKMTRMNKPCWHRWTPTCWNKTYTRKMSYVKHPIGLYHNYYYYPTTWIVTTTRHMMMMMIISTVRHCHDNNYPGSHPLWPLNCCNRSNIILIILRNNHIHRQKNHPSVRITWWTRHSHPMSCGRYWIRYDDTNHHHHHRAVMSSTETNSTL